MKIITDTPSGAAAIVGPYPPFTRSAVGENPSGLAAPIARLFGEAPLYVADSDDSTWSHLFIVGEAAASQYDAVVDLRQQGAELPHGILCLALSGTRFHGQRGRNWASPPGNLYLTACFTPGQPIINFGTGFCILAAVSLIDAIDAVPSLSGKAGIKWVNDIFIDDAKVAGYLTYTQNMSGMVTAAVIGIGLNVETTPAVPPDPFVPAVTSIAEMCPAGETCRQADLFVSLTDALAGNYRLLKAGHYAGLLDTYRERSIIMGRQVDIVSDPAAGSSERIASGRVVDIGENLEIYLEGNSTPVTRGRLILKS